MPGHALIRPSAVVLLARAHRPLAENGNALIDLVLAIGFDIPAGVRNQMKPFDKDDDGRISKAELDSNTAVHPISHTLSNPGKGECGNRGGTRAKEGRFMNRRTSYFARLKATSCLVIAVADRLIPGLRSQIAHSVETCKRNHPCGARRQRQKFTQPEDRLARTWRRH